MTWNTWRTKASGMRAWNRSDIELTNTTRGAFHPYGTSNASG